MILTNNQLQRVRDDWQKLAGDQEITKIEQIKSCIYTTISELGALRLLSKYRNTDKVRAFQDNNGNWNFSLELNI